MKDSYTTHDIAQMLNVTRVTVRNWIIKGRIEATTTPGGHRRIKRAELSRFLEDNNYQTKIIREYELTKLKKFVYCWEYHHDELVNLANRHPCKDCLVHKCRAQRCYILRQQAGHQKVHCLDECDECGYYHRYFVS